MRPCHIETPHGPHSWMPLVADPTVPRVLHLGMATIECPGVEQPAFTCPDCGAVSHHPVDVREGYCGRCHDWTRR